MTNRKIKFSKFFLKRFIPLTIAAAILYIITLFAFRFFMKDAFFGTRLMYEFPDVCTKMEELKLEATPEQKIGYISSLECDFMTDGETGVEKAMVAVNKETGEIIGSSDFAVYAVYCPDKKKPGQLFTCTDKAFIDFYMQFKDNPNVTMHSDEIYVNGSSFLPGKVTVEQLDDGPLGLVTGEIATGDFTPFADSDYEYLGEPTLLFAAGSLHDSEVMAKLVNSIKGENGMKLTFTSETEEYFYLSDYSSDQIYSSKSEIEIDGTVYDIYIYAEYHFWEFFAGANIITYAVILAVIFAVCIIWTKISYTKYSARYELDEARRNMVNALAHDLKSPLTAISGYAENLSEDVHPEKRGYYAKAIMDNAGYMNTIITSTLELSHTENATSVKPVQLDVSALAGELYEKYRPEAEGRGISCKSEGECVVQADRALTSQALENLITNAVKFTPNGGSITVKASAGGIAVTNTAEDTEKLKSLKLDAPFVKGDESRTNRSGTGLGLSIAKTACERQGFKLKISIGENDFTAEIRFKK